MPCYNCERTLEEAVDSIFVQKIGMPFEVVIVDDGSTDGTKELARRLAGEHEEIRIFCHEKNKGGGAARNTAVEKSTGDIIFCLDGDDILPPDMFTRMIGHMLDNGCSGVVFEETRYFFDDTEKISSVVKNKNLKRNIVFADFFDPLAGYLTAVNFLYTKEAFNKAGGYPVNHGFDTQGFGFRFLARNLSVGICPGSYYFHRQGRKKKSYFIRVYENGEYSRNIYLMIEDAIFLFSEKVRRMILDYDVFKNASLGNKNLKYELDNLYAKDKKGFFDENYNEMAGGDGWNIFLKKYSDGSRPEDIFCSAVCYFRKGDYQKSIDCYEKLIKQGRNTVLVRYNKLKATAALAGNVDINSLDNLVIKNFSIIRQKIDLNPNFFKKTIINLLKLLK